MITDTSDLLGQHATFQQTGLLAREVRIAGSTVTARFTSPRPAFDFAESTASVTRYTSTLRIALSEVPSITKPSDWDGVKIELPDGADWREYRVLMNAGAVHLGDDWHLQVETL